MSDIVETRRQRYLYRPDSRTRYRGKTLYGSVIFLISSAYNAINLFLDYQPTPEYYIICVSWVFYSLSAWLALYMSYKYHTADLRENYTFDVDKANAIVDYISIKYMYIATNIHYAVINLFTSGQLNMFQYLLLFMNIVINIIAVVVYVLYIMHRDADLWGYWSFMHFLNVITIGISSYVFRDIIILLVFLFLLLACILWKLKKPSNLILNYHDLIHCICIIIYSLTTLYDSFKKHEINFLID